MKRQSKFRAWDKVDKRMITHEQDFIPLKVTNIGVFRLDAKIKENRWVLMDADRFEITESIGMFDRNGKEIYESDICLIPAGFEGSCLYNSFVGFVDYEEDGFYINQQDNIKKTGKWSNQDYNWSDVKVIGNIYENSELLNK